MDLTEAKAKFSHLINIVSTSKEDVVLNKRGKAVAVVIPIEKYKQSNKEKIIIDESIESRFSKYKGIFNKEELDPNYKETRGDYLLEKYR